MEKVAVHTLVDCDDFTSVLDEFRMDDGAQMLILHIDVHRFSPAVYKDIIADFCRFRHCTDAPLFAFEPSPDDAKWERFMSPLNFHYVGRAPFPDGMTRRFYISVPHHEQQDDRN